MRLLILICWIFSFLFVVSSSTAQDQDSTALKSTIQQLKAQLEKVPDLKKVDLFNQLSDISKNTYPIEARNFAQNALELAKDIDSRKGQADALKNLGNIYQLQGNDSQALEFFLEALKIYEGIQNDLGIAQTLNNIGIVYQNQGKFEEARRYYDRVIAIDEKNQDKKGEASTLNNIGDLYYRQDDFEKSLEYYNRSLLIRQQINEKEGIAVSLKNIGLVYYAQNNYEKALENYLQSLKIDEELNNKAHIAATLNNIANTYLKLEKWQEALEYALKGLDIAEHIHLKKEIVESSFTLSDIYATLGDFEKAYQYQLLHIITQNELFNEENSKKINDLQTSYELGKKQIEIELLKKGNQLYQIIVWSISLGTCLIVVLALVLFFNNRKIQKFNQVLQLQNAEINQQKEEILTQRDAIEAQRDAIEAQRDEIQRQSKEIAVKTANIESSIRYAQRIQQAMLPYEYRIDETLPLHFIFYRPRDVVSGDFYWYAKVDARPIFEEGRFEYSEHSRMIGFSNEKIVFTAVDCTGHGVPGAFMSMIGDALLNQIVIDRGITKADVILSEMHKGIRKALKQNETQNKDGMDMALCVFDLKEKTVEYAGAKNSLIYIQNKELLEIDANKISVGGFRDDGEKDRVYTAHTISFKEHPITLYMYSDGFQDQFGGPDEKKFMRRRFKELLFEIHREPMSYQKEILEKTILDWKGHHEQVDDILVIGVRIE